MVYMADYCRLMCHNCTLNFCIKENRILIWDRIPISSFPNHAFRIDQRYNIVLLSNINVVDEPELSPSDILIVLKIVNESEIFLCHELLMFKSLLIKFLIHCWVCHPSEVLGLYRDTTKYSTNIYSALSYSSS
jgi:hypothetical protein